jgi:hypothetical protein
LKKFYHVGQQLLSTNTLYNEVTAGWEHCTSGSTTSEMRMRQVCPLYRCMRREDRNSWQCSDTLQSRWVICGNLCHKW